MMIQINTFTATPGLTELTVLRYAERCKQMALVLFYIIFLFAD